MLAIASCTTGGIASLAWENDAYFKKDTPMFAMVTFATATMAGQRLSVLPENENPAGPETAVPVLTLYYHRMKIQAGRRRRPFRY